MPVLGRPTETLPSSTSGMPTFNQNLKPASPIVRGRWQAVAGWAVLLLLVTSSALMLPGVIRLVTSAQDLIGLPCDVGNPESGVVWGTLRLLSEETRNYPALYEELYKPALAEPDGDYRMAQIDNYAIPASDPTCFSNGLCLLSATYLASEGSLDLMWQVGRSLDIPTMPLMSNPPPPGVYAGPRLSVFAQIVDSDDAYLSGDDGLWVDVESLQPGDLFIQRHRLSAPPGTDASAIIFGLYDPKTGVRYLAGERDFIRLDLTG